MKANEGEFGFLGVGRNVRLYGAILTTAFCKMRWLVGVRL